MGTEVDVNPRRRQLLGAVAALAAVDLRAAGAPVVALSFSQLAPGGALPDWLQPFAFAAQPRHTEFALVEDTGTTVLRARADASTAGLIRALSVDLARYPRFAWRWKATLLPRGSDPATREGDDFALRLYLTFEVDPDTLDLATRVKIALARAIWGERVPLAALCYVWSAQGAAGTMLPNAYTDRVRMIVIDAGERDLGRWRRHERDVADDYRRAFGLGPRATVPRVNAVIVSGDADNTASRSEGFFGDAAFLPRG